MQKSLERFLRYVTWDTASDYAALTFPSTEKQREFACFLSEECRQLGLQEVLVDRNGYVTCTLPASAGFEDVPVIGFLAHMDTSPDCSGKNVSPRLIEHYDGGEIVLNAEKGIVFTPERCPSLRENVGNTLAVTDGNTLLGADDKAGIAAILSAAEYLMQNPRLHHGKIRIAFTPDEEIGAGASRFDGAAFGVDFGYTVDGGALGEFEYENFNAAQAVVSVSGVGIHPGSAKNVMVNAALIAAEYAGRLPPAETPAHTEGYEGFYHLREIRGTVETAQLTYILRDFEENGLEQRKQTVIKAAQDLNAIYGPDTVRVKITDQYANMARCLQENPEVRLLALKAMEQLGIEPRVIPIRGGTDGAVLSNREDGFPCPNLFTGGYNAHGPYEYLAAESLEAAARVIARIALLAAQR